MESKLQDFFFHHSSHGTTMLHRLLVDKNRGIKHILLKYGLNINIDDDDSVYDISIDEIQSNFSNREIDELLMDHKEELDQIPIVYPILGVRNGLEVEFHYQIRGNQCQSILTRQFTADPIKTNFPLGQYSDYMVINAIGNERNMGIIQSIKLIKDGDVDIFYDINMLEKPSNKFCKNILCNIPNIEYDYRADFNVGLTQLVYDEYGDINPLQEIDDSNEDTMKLIKYPGSSFEIDKPGYLHAYSNESMNTSFLNLLMNGSGNVNWPSDEYHRYLGLKTQLHRNTTKIIINIYASHCLNPQVLDEHDSIGNVLPFITDYNQEWSRMYLDELADGAEEEVEYQGDLLEESADKIEDMGDYIEELNKEIIDYKQEHSKLPKPLLVSELLPDGWSQEIDKDGENYYYNQEYNKATYDRREIPYIKPTRQSRRERNKLIDKLDTWDSVQGMMTSALDELKDNSDEYADQLKKHSSILDRIDKATKVRKATYDLHNKNVDGDVGEILSYKRKKKKSHRKKSHRKKSHKKRKSYRKKKI